MVQPIVQDDFEKTSVKPVAANPLHRPASGLDWLEKMAPAGFKPKVDPDAKKREDEQKKQTERLANLDKQRSRQMYEEIQKQIMLIRKKKQSQPAKYITGASGYDKEQHENPESFWDKVRKKKEALKKKLPWQSRQSMGTGEITRGVSG